MLILYIVLILRQSVYKWCNFVLIWLYFSLCV